MKRFLAFAYECYPGGGRRDFVGDFDELREAVEALDERDFFDVLDTVTGEWHDKLERRRNMDPSMNPYTRATRARTPLVEGVVVRVAYVARRPEDDHVTVQTRDGELLDCYRSQVHELTDRSDWT